LSAWCVRHTDERAVDGIKEAIETGRASGARVQVSHAMPMPGSPPDMMERTFEMVDGARRDGVDTGFDMHTRPFGEVNLSVALPVWALEGGRTSLSERLSLPATRARIKAYPSLVSRFLPDPGASGMVLALTRNPDLIGKTLAELTPAGGDPLDTVLDVLRDEVDDVHRPLILIMMYPEDRVARFYSHPLCAVASDATTLSAGGPLGDAVFYGAYTWAAWFLRRMVRERGTLSLGEAIRRLSSLPASRAGLADRGAIREGAPADLAVFDLASTAEHGTLEAPNQLATGMVHVLVNGAFSLRDRRFTEARPGEVLRFRS
jgi:N-acyl-D-aspartate/D-glutamate deacylase